jgi:hypothetical protein
VLYAQLVGIVAHPISGLARTMNQLIGGLAVALGQVQEKGVLSGNTAEAPAEDAPAPEAEAAPEAEVPTESAEETPPAEEDPDAGPAGDPEPAQPDQAEGEDDSSAEPTS